MNVTFLSLNLYSLISTSSFYTVNHYYDYKISTTIFNSHFSHFFESVIYSNSNYHKIALQKDSFLNALNSVIKFDNSAKSIITNKYITTQFHYSDLNEYGDITISSCHFKNCHSKLGGAIYITQKSLINLNNIFFENCSAEVGSCCYILTNSTIYTNDKLTNYNENFHTNVQYCCFSQFKVDSNLNENKNGYGSILYIASENVNFFYSSSIYPTYKREDICESRGALFDLQSSQISMKNINSTNGRSKSCGCIEFKYSKSGMFRFLSIASIESVHLTSFSEFECDTIEISFCNMVNNILRKSESGTFSSLFSIGHNDIRITDSVFLRNNYGETGRIVSKFDQNDQNQIIILINCLSDNYRQTESEEFIDVSCDFTRQNITSHFIDHLNLGHCEGNSAAPQTFSEPSQKHSNQPKILDVSYSATQTITMTKIDISTNVKSVTFTYGPIESNTFTDCGDNSYCETNIYSYTQSYFIIYSMSLTQTITPVVTSTDLVFGDPYMDDLVKRSKKIGKICVIVEVVLIVVSLIIFIVRKKCTKDDYVINEASSDEFGETNNLENVEQTNECEVNIIRPSENIANDDNWI